MLLRLQFVTVVLPCVDADLVGVDAGGLERAHSAARGTLGRICRQQLHDFPGLPRGESAKLQVATMPQKR